MRGLNQRSAKPSITVKLVRGFESHTHCQYFNVKVTDEQAKPIILHETRPESRDARRVAKGSNWALESFCKPYKIRYDTV